MVGIVIKVLIALKQKRNVERSFLLPWSRDRCVIQPLLIRSYVI